MCCCTNGAESKQRRSHDGIEFHLWADFKRDACVIRTASLGRAQEISLVI
jgi:hypothetical protein